MYNIQLLLPISDNSGKPFPTDMLKDIQRELQTRFGGLTAYNRAPAQGIWETGGAPARDDIVIVEVMAETLDRLWWQGFRSRVETVLRQKMLIVRATKIELL